MKALVIEAPNIFRLKEVEIPRCSDNEVLIKVAAVGICQSDIDLYKGEHPNWALPRIPGHEISGVIAQLGSEVRNILLGQRVVVDPVITCGRCIFCKNNELGCIEGGLIGGTTDGGLQEYISVDSKNVIPIPDYLPLEEAAVLEPLACAFTAFNHIKVRPEHTVAVLGPGMGGLCLVQIAKAQGAGKVILTGTRDERLKLGEKLGADITVNVNERNAIQAIRDETGGHGADIVFEAAGNPTSIIQSLDIVKTGGKIVLYGAPITLIDGFDIRKVNVKNLTLISGVGPWNAFESAIVLAAKKKVLLNEMITHKFRAIDAEQAYRMVGDRKNGIFKAILTWD